MHRESTKDKPLNTSVDTSDSTATLAGPGVSRRAFLHSSSIIGITSVMATLFPTASMANKLISLAPSVSSAGFAALVPPQPSRAEQAALKEFGYADVVLSPGRHQSQFESTVRTLLAISDDNMLKPFRARAGLPAPGQGIGGWYEYNPAYDGTKGGDAEGFAPGHCFGQWLSALARAYAINGSPEVLDKLKRLLAGYDKTICKEFYENFRFPAYTYDKLVCGLLDAYRYAGLKEALPILERTTEAALPNLPPRALERGELPPAHPERDYSFTWDESYTLPENLFLAYQLGLGDKYRELAMRFLMDKTYFVPLAQGQNPLPGKHAYSYMNALSSAMRAHLVLDSNMHLDAARNALDIIHAQSYVTGGWGPDETFVEPGKGTLGKSLFGTHHSFETCGGYAHMKLTRYLLRVTRNARYGDSMERVIQNTVLGVKDMEPNGNAFYYSDYNFNGHKDFYWMKCPCCAGTLPQIVADYRVCTYLKDKDGPLVNLYIPGTVTWKQGGAKVSLTQKTSYPLQEGIDFTVSASVPQTFDLRLRIPEWAGDRATIHVNDKLVRKNHKPGTFASVKRKWKEGDRVSLSFPLQLTLTTIDPEHPDLAALSYGALALFAVHASESEGTSADASKAAGSGSGTGAGASTGASAKVPKATKEELLAAKRSPHRDDEWLVQTSNGTMSFMPFTSIKEQHYSAYVSIA
jgi:DUF1680 family protein